MPMIANVYTKLGSVQNRSPFGELLHWDMKSKPMRTTKPPCHHACRERNSLESFVTFQETNIGSCLSWQQRGAAKRSRKKLWSKP